MSGEGAFVRTTLAPPRSPPARSGGLLALIHARLFKSPFDIALTVASLVLFLLVAVPALRFLLVDAVWQGDDRTACLADGGRTVGACWPFIAAKFEQLIYGFYPSPERWRVNLTFLLGALLLAPLLIPRAPAKTLNAALFFFAFPFVGFFLLRGGGLQGFALAWITHAGEGLAASLHEAGGRLAAAGSALALPGRAVTAIGDLVGLVVTPLAALRDVLQQTAPLWADVALTAVVVAVVVFAIGGGWRNGWRALLWTLGAFAALALVIAVMGLDRGGLPVVDTRLWGGLLVTLVVSVTGIVASMPIGMALALGRRSTLPLVRIASIAFIEFWRGVPLVTVMFFATYMLPLFLPGNFSVDGLLRVLIGIALFAGAYNAEVIRGGLQAVPRGQSEAAAALGLSYWKTTGLIVMPQALRHVIPGLVNSFIALFKDTTLVLIVAIFDLLGQLRAAFADPNWATPTTLFTGFAFTGMIYFVFCFGMSRYSLFVERRLNAHKNV